MGTIEAILKNDSGIAQNYRHAPKRVTPGESIQTKDGWRFTIGKGLNDDRYIYRYVPNEGFTKLFACPDFTGSYLSFDGQHYYFSQWYKGLIHEVDDSGRVFRTINVGAEICGHTF